MPSFEKNINNDTLNTSEWNATMIARALVDKYLKLLRNYQGYFLVAWLHISYVAKKYQQGISGAIVEDGFKPCT